MVGKVLIVDDEDTLRLTIKARLSAGGFETDGAVDGEEAIEKLKQTPFDVVLLDINMPRMDGITALGIISEQYPATDVIMLTGFADFSTAIDCLKKGAKDYLVKPIDTTELITRLRSLIRARNSEAALDTIKKTHASFLFDHVVSPVVKLHDTLGLLSKGELGKLTKEQLSILKDLEEIAQGVVSEGLNSLDPALLAAEQGGDRKETSLEKVLDGISEFVMAQARSKDVEFVSMAEGKLPKVSGEAERLREAFRSVAAAAVGIAAKKTTVSLEAPKESGERITVTVTVEKADNKGQAIADQMGKPLESTGVKFPKLEYEAILLYSAKRALVAQGGSLTVDSKKGKVTIDCEVSKK